MKAATAPVWLLLLCLASAGLALYLAAFARQRRSVAAASEFSLFMFAVAAYSAGYAVELTRADLAGMLAAIRVEYLGIVSLGPLSLAFAWRFSRGRALPRPLALLLAAFALATLALAWTTEGHGLFYLEPRVSVSGPFPALAFGRGPWYLAHLAVLELATVASAAILVREAIGSEPRRRRQSTAMAAAGIIPILVLLARLAGLVPSWLDSGPFSLVLTGALFALALFRLGFLELVPAARELAIDALRDGFLVADPEGRLLDANPAARAMLGMAPGGAGRGLDPATWPGGTIAPLLEAGEGSLDFGDPAPAGGGRSFTAKAYPIPGPSGTRRGTVLLVSDVTESASLLARLRELADRDGLTGLLNRRSFLERAARELELARRAGYHLGFVLVDLDRFKEVNDRNGHGAGDAVLVAAARRFVASLRAVDLVCRYGGEEFAILMPGADGGAALATAERARRDLEASRVEWQGRTIGVTGSFGCYSSPPEGRSGLEECLRRADEALYAAKAAGRNRVAEWRDGNGSADLRS